MRGQREALIAYLVGEHTALYLENLAFRRSIDMLANSFNTYVKYLARRATVETSPFLDDVDSMMEEHATTPVAFDSAVWEMFRDTIRASGAKTNKSY
jgi:hypothetical protein